MRHVLFSLFFVALINSVNAQNDTINIKSIDGLMGLDLNKTLEQLENDYWAKPNYDSYLVKTCHALRKKPLNAFEVEDLRIMIGQDIGLSYLIPLALAELEKDLFVSGDYYEGDLLKSVLTSDKEFWKEHTSIKNKVIALLSPIDEKLDSDILGEDIAKDLKDAFIEFKK